MTKIYSKVLYFMGLKNHCSLLTVLALLWYNGISIKVCDGMEKKKENKNLKLNGKKIKLFIFSIFVLFLIIMMILMPFYIEKVIGKEILE